MACLASVNCRHVKTGRTMKFNICEECTELLNETITKALVDLENFSRCFEINVNSTSILDGTEKNMKEAKGEMVSVLLTLIHQNKLIQYALGKYKLDACPQNVEKHLTMILCLSRGVSKQPESCLTRVRVEEINLSSDQKTIDGTGNYIRRVYSTLERFVSNLQ